MIEAIYDDVKHEVGKLIDETTLVENFIYLGEEHILQDANPPRIVIIASSETLHSGGKELDAYGRPVQPFARSRVIIKLYVFARTYTEARLLVFGFLQALDNVRAEHQGSKVRKYNILKQECTISYDTWNDKRGYRMATCTVPIENVIMATEVTWVRINKIIHECGIMLINEEPEEESNGEEEEPVE